MICESERAAVLRLSITFVFSARGHSSPDVPFLLVLFQYQPDLRV